MADEEEIVDGLEELEKPQIDPVTAELQQTKDQLARLAAEFDNFRKRNAREREELTQFTKAGVFKELLPTLDNFERALAGVTDSEEFLRGVNMIYEQLLHVLTTQGVQAFGEEGETFDPAQHNAVMHSEDETRGAQEIVRVLSKGYKIGNRVIREAMVAVVN
ncbi:MAG: nucleotide exchange factor GrpE [Oscillospiraceae bacterium]|jgi:molecular chaperone GrpE|nr:nucleotide exchange factor GrpE [Oscillospiraceae bacterium]